MPRDLSAMADDSTLSGMPSLSKASGEMMNHHSSSDVSEDEEYTNTPPMHVSEKRNTLHPYTQTLSTSDVESCVRLEESAFPPHERASREKFQYRLARCGELSMGIFTSRKNSTLPTAETSAPVYSGAPDRKAVLLGHIVATRTTNLVVTDNDMAIPSSDDPDPNLGHKEHGRTVCIHSLAIYPAYHKHGLGTTLMKAYLQRLESQDVADRVALITHEQLIPWYEKFGFENKGESEAQFGGGGWYDMAKELNSDV